MHTEHVEYLLPDYASGMLEASLLPWVESHLSECPSCRSELEQLRTSMASLAAHEPKPPHDKYFSTVLPRVRARLEDRRSASLFAHPLVTRFAAPLAAGALVLVILFRVPFTVRDSGIDRNPLQPVMHGLEAEELVDVILDQSQRQTISSHGESETSSLLAMSFLHSEHLLAGAEQLPLPNESVLDVGVPENLDQLNPAEVDALVTRLGERTIL